MPPRRRRNDRWRLVLNDRWRLTLSIALGALVAYIGPGLLPATEGAVGPTRMALRADAGVRGTTVEVPPLGQVHAATHVAPMHIELQLVQVEVESLARSATSSQGRQELRVQVASDLRSLATRAAAQFIVLIGVLALGAGALLLGRRRMPLIVTPLTAIVLSGAGFGWIAASYDLEAFEEPRFTGSLAKAQVVVDAVARGAEALDEARSRFEVAGDRLGTLMSLLAQSNANPQEAETVILHVSDIHANPLGFEVVGELAQRFDVDAIVDTGDLASAELDTGEISTLIDPLDRLIGREIAAVSAPYLYVPGNHDSPQLRSAVAGADNVTLLDGTSADVGSVEVFGWADPTFSTKPIPESEKSLQRADEASQVAAAVSLQQPEIVAVHDSILVQDSLGLVPVVLAGHTHERSQVLEEGTLVLTVGSTGATGVKTLAIEAGRPYEAQVLYIEDEMLIAVDYVSLEDLGGDFELSRETYAHPLTAPPVEGAQE